MNSKMQEFRVQDIALEMGDAPFGSNLKNTDYTEHGALVVQGRNVQGRTFDWSEKRHVSFEKWRSIPRSHCYPGDLVFPKVGTIGKVGILSPCKGYDKYILSTNTMKLKVDPSKADQIYVYYFFTWKKIVDLIHAMNSKSVQPVFNFTTLKNFPIVLPPLAYQSRVAEILGALDDKIELNRQINQTLEQIAQAIFKSWFVDFEPVKAKIEARAAGSDPRHAAMCAISGAVQGCTNAAGAGRAGAIRLEPKLDQLSPEQRQQLATAAALFPDELVESELGLIPKGWEAQRLEYFLELSYGKALKKNNRNDGDVPVYGSGGITGFHSSPLVSGPGIIVGRKGTVGALYWEDRDFFAIDTVFYANPKNGAALEFLYYLLQTLGLEKMNTDAAVPGLNRNNVYRLPVPRYPKNLMDVFAEMIGTFRTRIYSGLREIEILSELRDFLLPKLLSGEIEIQ